jgi:hypothetical protein
MVYAVYMTGAGGQLRLEDMFESILEIRTMRMQILPHFMFQRVNHLMRSGMNGIVHIYIQVPVFTAHDALHAIL